MAAEMTQTTRRKKRKSQQSSEQLPTQSALLDLRAFTGDFFRLFGSQVRPLDDHEHGTLHVTLPTDLVEHFGKPELGLSFQTVADGSGHDLVAHGSRMFDRMLALLDRRSALTVLRLPVRHQGSDQLLSAVRLLNAGVADLRMQEQTQSLFFFNWRITYRADDKREEIYTIVLDESGARLLQPGDINAPPDVVAPETLLADGEPVQQEQNQEGHLLPPKLPPLAQLVRLAERARQFVVYHADLRCVSYEAEILPRLYKVLDRLTTYYGQQIEEISETHDPQGEKRAALESDLQRKIAEEVENHRLRVQADLVSYAVLDAPMALAEMTLSDGARDASIQVRLNRYTGGLHRPQCHACGQEASAIALCRNGHVMCDDCVRQCDCCQDVLCAECGVQPCPVCKRQNCDRCGRVCWACGERACGEHISRCPVCGDDVCHACQSECAQCGVRQCRSHLRSDCVLAADGAARFICPTCAVRCPGCHQYSSQTVTCSASGQRFCANCIVACVECGRLVGPGFYSLSGVEQAPLCRTCVKECPRCHAPSSGVLACAACTEPCCTNCSQVCVACQQVFCRKHIHQFKQCGHAVCANHLEQCGVGREAICPQCARWCGICERRHCSYHTSKCAWCGTRYCSECVRSMSGLCDTCAEAARSEDLIDILTEPCGSLPSVSALAEQYLWRRASNQAATIYLGVGANNVVIVVADRQPDGAPRAVTRRLSSFDLIRARIG
jgi:hypothetical protein